MTEELAAHYSELAQTCQHITLVFDKGNNSQESFDTLASTSFHFVGSLVQVNSISFTYSGCDPPSTIHDPRYNDSTRRPVSWVSG